MVDSYTADSGSAVVAAAAVTMTVAVVDRCHCYLDLIVPFDYSIVVAALDFHSYCNIAAVVVVVVAEAGVVVVVVVDYYEIGLYLVDLEMVHLILVLLLVAQ